MSPRLSPRTGDHGVTAVEYALIVFLVAIGMLIGVVLMTRTFSAAFAASADSAGGLAPTPPQTSSAPAQPQTDGEDDDHGNGVPSKPGAPTAVTATRSANGEITVSWSEPGSNGGRAITGYLVEFEVESQVSTCDSSVTGWNNGSASAQAADRSARKSGLGSEWYCIRVYAANGVTSGSTAYAYAGPVYSGASKPAAPTGVTATRSAVGALTVSWTEPGSNGGSAITGYSIGFEKDGIGSSSACTASSGNYADATDSAGASATSEAKSGLGSAWYCVRIAADNAGAGALTYAYAGPVFTGANKPSAPTSVSAVRSGKGEVRVSWTAPGSNGGSAITGYAIGYENDGITSSSTCASASGDYADASDSAAADKTSAKKNGLGANWYCVRIAADNAGTGSLNYAYAGPVNSD